MTINAAKIRLQQLLQDGSVKIRHAPTQPVTSADVLPLSLAHLDEGEGIAESGTTLRFLPTILLDVHFPRTFTVQVHEDIDTVVTDMMQRLSGDPTLDSSVDTIVFPVSFYVIDDVFDEVETRKLSFSIPVKIRLSPVTGVST